MTEEIEQNLPNNETQENDPSNVVDMLQETVEEFLATADVQRVYSKPIKKGETTIIPAAEIIAGMGFGVGVGSGSQEENSDHVPVSSGGGGGGKSVARPVALIIAEPGGVRVEPVIDSTKIILATLTTIGFMVSTLVRIKRGK
ncbi:MAG: hypothetical protein J7L73_08880 [Anaerolineales bacterium]|nr:hypothetical protein [Anaerolineales bacterium]